MKRNWIVSVFLSGLLVLNGCSSPSAPEQANSDQTDASDPPVVEETVKTLSADELSSIQADESGEIMVLMYHNIGEEEATWTRTPDNFRKDLETLYEKGFRTIRLEDYASGNISTEAGFTPVVITFDDGKENNFRYLEGKQIDPNCAVGIMEDFKQKHPDFNMTATFFLNGLAFGEKEQEKDKLEFLVQNGYSIGNHTMTHPSLRKLTPEDIQKEIASLKSKFETLCPDVTINTLALPFGEKPKGDDAVYTYQGTYENTSYENIAVLLVGWDPYLSPYDKAFDFANIHRVRASETNVDNVGLYNWLEAYEKGSKIRYISDGNPQTIAVPNAKSEKIDTAKFREKTVITY